MCCNCRQHTRGRPRKQLKLQLASAPAMSMGIVAESVVPWSICTVHPAAPAAADTVVLSPAILATVPTAVPANIPSAVPANVPSAVPANVPTAVPATAATAVPATVPTAVPATVPSYCSYSCPCYCSYSCPCYCSYSCPCYCSYSCPCYCSYSCPATVPTDVPATVPTDVPATVPTDVPATVPTDVPATVPTDVPATVLTDVPSCNADYGCRDHIFQVLSLLGIQANSDMNNLPSAKDRKVARVKEDLTEDGFRRVKPLFWKGVKGWIKVFLPAWNLPDDKVLKLFSLPSGPFDAKDGADDEGTGALDDHTLVTKSIVQATKQEKSFHIVRIWLCC